VPIDNLQTRRPGKRPRILISVSIGLIYPMRALTGWFAISCVRPSPVTANSPSLHVATSTVGLVTATPPVERIYQRC